MKYQTRRENTTAIDNPENTTPGRFYQSAGAAYTQVKKAPFGTFAGGKFFGARGIWVENISDPNNRELIDAAGVTHTPPVSITVSVTGLAVGDRALVALDDGTGAIDKTQYTVGSVTSSSIVMSTPEHIEAILNAPRKMSYYRVNLNPDTYRWRIVCGCTDKPVGNAEWETKAEAETAIMGVRIQ